MNMGLRFAAFGSPAEAAEERLPSQVSVSEKTELRKADRAVGVNCNVLSNISSGRWPFLTF